VDIHTELAHSKHRVLLFRAPVLSRCSFSDGDFLRHSDGYTRIDAWQLIVGSTDLLQMLPLIDRELLVQVEQAGLPRNIFALRRVCRRLRFIVEQLPHILAKCTGRISWLSWRRIDSTGKHQAVLCMGTHGATLYLSLRTVHRITMPVLNQKLIFG